MHRDYDEDNDDPTDPSHRDHDLSTSAAYDFDEPVDKPSKFWFVRRGVLIVVGLLLVISLVLPYLLRF